VKRPLDHTETAPDLVRPRSTDSSELATPPIGFDDTVVRPAPIEVVRTHRPLVAPILLLFTSVVISSGLVAWGTARGSNYAPIAPFRMDPIRIPRDNALDFESLARPRTPLIAPAPSPSNEPRKAAAPRPLASAEPRRPSAEPRRPSPTKSAPPPSPTAAAPAPSPMASPSPAPPGSGALNIVVRQGGRSVPATIHVDGRLIGQAPLQHITSVGSHEIEASGLGQAVKRRVDVAPNTSVRVAIDLPD
jgi:hypothetical protein